MAITLSTIIELVRSQSLSYTVTRIALGNAPYTLLLHSTTPLINQRERIGETQIGVAAEASANLTHDLSVSLLKIFNTDRPPQVGLR